MTPRTCRKAVFLSPFSSQFAEFNQITLIPSEKWKPFLSNKWTRYRKYRLVIPFFTLSSGGCIYAHIWSSKVHLLTNPFFDIRLVVSPTVLYGLALPTVYDDSAESQSYRPITSEVCLWGRRWLPEDSTGQSNLKSLSDRTSLCRL